MLILLILLLWVICGWLTYGIDLAYKQREWPRLAQKDRNTDRLWALAYACFGPIGLVSVLIGSGFGLKHGVMWRSPKEMKNERL